MLIKDSVLLRSVHPDGLIEGEIEGRVEGVIDGT
jgi:hypothetical protein